MSEVQWRRINNDPFEYAIQQGPSGDEFVKLLDDSCLRRPAPVGPEFLEFPKIARLAREIIVTEKIDGSNGVIYIGEDGEVLAGSRSQWLIGSDNFGFAKWVKENEDALRLLGPGRHYGEWWGSGIQRGYGLPKGEKRFSLFNVARWDENVPDARPRPTICHVVPVLYRGPFLTEVIEAELKALKEGGSRAAPGFMKPEGVVIFHPQGNVGFKKTIEKDEEWKGKSAAA
jgi:hypothetical protein